MAVGKNNLPLDHGSMAVHLTPSLVSPSPSLSPGGEWLLPESGFLLLRLAGHKEGASGPSVFCGERKGTTIVSSSVMMREQTLPTPVPSNHGVDAEHSPKKMGECL